MTAPASLDQLVDDLLRATGLLIRRVRAEHPHELTISLSQAMGRLADNGAMTTAELARAESVKPQSMGQTLAALEQEGLVSRQPHPTDGRQVLVRLTDRGAAVRKANSLAKRRWLTTVIGRLDSGERQTLAQAVRILWRIADQ